MCNEDAKAGVTIASQSFGDFQKFNPHLHVMASSGSFYNNFLGADKDPLRTPAEKRTKIMFDHYRDLARVDQSI